MAEVVNIDGQASSRAIARDFLVSRFADVLEDPGGGWTALCPLCDSGARISIRRDMRALPCPNGHNEKAIFDAAQPRDEEPRTGIGTLSVALTPERIRAEPPRREYLFSVAKTGVGVFPRGKVGMLAARGGSGKSYLLAQLAVSVATGTTWLGSGAGWAAKQGRVLWLPAEEDEEEVMRRLHLACKVAGLLTNAEDLDTICRNITVIPLCGYDVALATQAEFGKSGLPETERAAEIRDLLRAAAVKNQPFSLLLMDPMSRFSSADVEKDNAAATRFVQVLETFTTEEFERPSVLLSHHVGKPHKDATGSDPIRGVTGIVDAVRWAALLSPERHKEGPDLLKLEVVKTNYARRPPTLTLCRPDDWGGAMRVALPEEIEGGASACDADLDEIYQSIGTAPASGAELARRLNIRKEDVLATVSRLAALGRIKRYGNVWRIAVTVPNGSRGSQEPDPRTGSRGSLLKKEGNRREAEQGCAGSLENGTENPNQEHAR